MFQIYTKVQSVMNCLIPSTQFHSYQLTLVIPLPQLLDYFS